MRVRLGLGYRSLQRLAVLSPLSGSSRGGRPLGGKSLGGSSLGGRSRNGRSMPPEVSEGAACLSTPGRVAAENCGRAGSRSRLLALMAEAPLATPTVLVTEGALTAAAVAAMVDPLVDPLGVSRLLVLVTEGALLPPIEVEAGPPTTGSLAAMAVPLDMVVAAMVVALAMVVAAMADPLAMVVAAMAVALAMVVVAMVDPLAMVVAAMVVAAMLVALGAAMVVPPLDPLAVSDPLASDPPASDPLASASSLVAGTESRREKPAPCSIAAPLAAAPLVAGPRCASVRVRVRVRDRVRDRVGVSRPHGQGTSRVHSAARSLESPPQEGQGSALWQHQDGTHSQARVSTQWPPARSELRPSRLRLGLGRGASCMRIR